MLKKLSATRLFAAFGVIAAAILLWLFSVAASPRPAQRNTDQEARIAAVVKLQHQAQKEIFEDKQEHEVMVSKTIPQAQATIAAQKAAQDAAVKAQAVRDQTEKAGSQANQATIQGRVGSTHAQAVSRPVQKASAPSSYGITMAGRTFSIGSFSGTGVVPAGIVYQWTGAPNYYLADAGGASGAAARSLGIGSTVIIRGRVFLVTSILHHVNSYYGEAAIAGAYRHAASIQTCINGHTDMNVYYLD